MATHYPNRLWETCLKKALPRETRSRLRSKVKKIKESNQGISSTFLKSILSDLPNFIGVFSQDFLFTLKIVSFPVCFIVNLDLSSEPGSHWIAFFITDKKLEIYDSFGLDNTTWAREPFFLFNFIDHFPDHKISISPRLQPTFSNLCGVYSVFFLIFRQCLLFPELIKLFSTDLDLNSTVLLSFFE